MVKSCISVNPLRHLKYIFFALAPFRFWHSLINLFSKFQKIFFIYIQECDLNVLIFFIICYYKLRVIQKFVGFTIRFCKGYVIDMEWHLFKEMIIKFSLELVISLEWFRYERISRFLCLIYLFLFQVLWFHALILSWNAHCNISWQGKLNYIWNS